MSISSERSHTFDRSPCRPVAPSRYKAGIAASDRRMKACIVDEAQDMTATPE